MYKPKVLISVLTGFERNAWVHPQIDRFLEDLRLKGDSVPFRWLRNDAHAFIPAASARNQICEYAVDHNWDWIVMIDNDMAPPSNLLDMIANAPADAAVVVPRMWMWDGAHKAVTLCWGLSYNPTPELFAKVLAAKGYTEIIKSGTGVMAIRRETFFKITTPWFWYEYHPVTAAQLGTEDVNFCAKVRAAGLKIYGCNDIEVGHYHNVDLADVAKLLYTERVLTYGLGVDKEVNNGIIAVGTNERPSEVPEVAASPAC